jgi:hypothetical protein
MIVLALPTIASAQWRDNDDDYYRNSRYNRNIRGTIQNLKNRARNFERRIDRVDDRRDDRDDDWYGRRGRNDRYDNLDQLASQFRRATADLADEYGNGRNLNGSRDEARRVLDIGSQIDNMLYRSRGGNRQIQNEWGQIRYDLRVLSDTYGFGNYNGGGNRNRSGDWRNRVPFPLPF